MKIDSVLFIYLFIFSQIVRLLANHPYFGITLMTADRKAGQSMGSVFPHLVTQVSKYFFYVLKINFDFGVWMNFTIVIITDCKCYSSDFAYFLRLVKYVIVVFLSDNDWVHWFFAGSANYGFSYGCGLFQCGCCVLLFASWNYSGAL